MVRLTKSSNKQTSHRIINDPDFSGKSMGNIREMTGKNVKLTPEEQLLNDIEDSLKQLEGTPMNSNITAAKLRSGHSYQPTTSSNKSGRIDRPTHSNKKRKSTIGRIIKWIVIILILAVVGLAGWLTVKAFIASNNVFNGNPLAILTTKTRLSEDENGRTNILIFGTSGYEMSESAWDGAMLTDSIMVLSIDQDNYDAYMMSLPRDLYVRNNCPVLDKTFGKLNEVFYCAYAEDNNEQAGAEALMAKAGEILGLDIDYYAHADWTALVESVNAVGGIDVTIETDNPNGIYDSSTGLRYAQGEVAHLDGEKALALARARNHNYGDFGLESGNYAREQNQQRILAALQQKALSMGTILNPVAVSGLIDSLGNNLITNFDSSHVQTLIDIASNVPADKINRLPFVSRLDGGPDLIGSYSPNGSYLGEAPLAGVYDYEDIQEYVKQNLTADPVAKEGAVIDVLNGSDIVGLAAEEADKLEADGFTVGEIDNSPVDSTATITVYQLNANKTATAEALKTRYSIDITQGGLAGYETTADFIILLGGNTNNTSN